MIFILHLSSFGHGGEVALHYMMRNHGGFEGNGQTLRIVAHLEPFSESCGMNLARRTLLGLLKYPQTIDKLSQKKSPTEPLNYRQLKASDWHPPKGIYQDDVAILDWILAPLSQEDKLLFQSSSSTSENKHAKTLFKSLDCSIMELADDIAYGIHDLEDAIVTGVVQKEDFDNHVVHPLRTFDDAWLNDICQHLSEQLFSQFHHKQKEAIGGIVNYLITAIKLTDLNEQDICFDEPLLRYNAKLPDVPSRVLKILKDFVYNYVIKLPSIQHLEYRGQQIVMELFEALASDPLRLLPKNSAQRWQDARDNGLNESRVIADYVSGMTDEYAANLYQTLFVPTARKNYRSSNI